MTERRSNHPIIASRRLTLSKHRGDAAGITVRIRRPYRSGEDYNCEYEISGFSSPMSRKIRGTDSLQALLLAIVAIQKSLRPYRKRLSWLGSDGGDDGLPYVLLFEDISNKRLCQLIDVVIERYEAELAVKMAARVNAAHGEDLAKEAETIESQVRDQAN